MHSISNGPTRPSCTAPMRAPFRHSRIRTWWRSGRRRRKNSNCWSRFAARCRTRYSASPTCRRCPTARVRTAACCARPSQLLQRRRLSIKDGKRLLPNGEPFTIEFLIDEPSIAAAPRALHQESRHARHRGQLAAGRSRCNIAPAWKISISTLRSSASACRRRRATHCVRTSRRRPRRPRARTISPASQTRRSTR